MCHFCDGWNYVKNHTENIKQARGFQVEIEVPHGTYFKPVDHGITGDSLDSPLIVSLNKMGGIQLKTPRIEKHVTNFTATQRYAPDLPFNFGANIKS